MQSQNCKQVLAMLVSEIPELKQAGKSICIAVKAGNMTFTESSWDALKIEEQAQFTKIAGFTPKDGNFSAGRDSESAEIISGLFPQQWKAYQDAVSTLNKALDGKLGESKGPRVQSYIRGEKSRNSNKKQK